LLEEFIFRSPIHRRSNRPLTEHLLLRVVLERHMHFNVLPVWISKSGTQRLAVSLNANRKTWLYVSISAQKKRNT
jgi:hypothetical protein